jgi:decaprenylphospho-beta-D-erythro-pentofuranosid-2-ulose 2-reductase
MQKVIVLGATSGIAQCLQRLLARNGKELLLVGRSPERLAALQTDLLVRGAGHVLTFAADLSDTSSHADVVAFTRECFPEFDTVLLAYGTLLDQQQCQRSIDLMLRELHTNFVSAAALLTAFAKELEDRRTGCIAAITSVAGDRGRRTNYVYGAAKGGLSLFLQGLRSRLHPAGVRVITIKPGPVDTAMTAHLKLARRADPRIVTASIYRALERRSPDVLYTPGLWRYVMAAVRFVPESWFKRLSL